MRHALALSLAVAAIAACGGDEPMGSADDFPEPPSRGTYLAITGWESSKARLQAFGLRTLRPVGPAIPITRDTHASARSPSGKTVALAAGRRVIEFVDLRTGRRRHVELLPNTRRWLHLTALAWPRPRRLIALLGEGGANSARGTVVRVDPRNGRVLAHREVGRAITWAVRKTGLAMVTRDRAGIGPSKLAWADAAGITVSSIARVASGEGPTRTRTSHVRTPGLAVAPDGGRAVVVSAGEALAADVDLRRGRVVYHDLGRQAGPLAALHDLLEPEAHAGGGYLVGARRDAAWVAADRVAVAGEDYPEPGETDAWGLRLLDLDTWRLHRLEHASVPEVLHTGRRLFAVTGDGIVAYDLEGRRRYRRFAGRRAADWYMTCGILYARPRYDGPTHVLDAETGKTIRRVKERYPNRPLFEDDC